MKNTIKRKGLKRIALMLSVVLVLLLAMPLGASAAPQTIPDGTYYIVTKLNDNKVLDILNKSKSDGGTLQLCTLNYGTNQQFKVTHLGNGYYTISPVHSGKVIDIKDKSTKSGATVHQWTYKNGENQKWYIYSTGDGYFNIVSSFSGKYLNVNNGSTAANTKINVLDSLYGANQQKFKFVSTSGPKYATKTEQAYTIYREPEILGFEVAPQYVTAYYNSSSAFDFLQLISGGSGSVWSGNSPNDGIYSIAIDSMGTDVFIPAGAQWLNISTDPLTAAGLVPVYGPSYLMATSVTFTVPWNATDFKVSSTVPGVVPTKIEHIGTTVKVSLSLTGQTHITGAGPNSFPVTLSYYY